MSKRPRAISPEVIDVLRRLAISFKVILRGTGKKPRVEEFEDYTSALALETAARADGTLTEAYACAAISERLETKVYNGFKDVLLFIGGTWHSRSEEHRFSGNPLPLINEVIRLRELPAANPLDFYPTPRDVVEGTLRELSSEVDLLRCRHEVDPSFRALEPHGGRGGIAFPLAEALGSRRAVKCVELNPLNHAALVDAGFDADLGDFLQWETAERFDLIVLNPPFAGRTWRKHLLHAHKFLSDRGRLACIAPIGAIDCHSEDAVQFLRWALARGKVEKLGTGLFHDAGTDIETVCFYLRKEPQPRAPHDGYPSYACLHFDMLVSQEYEYNTSLQAAADRIITSLGDQISQAEAAGLSVEQKEDFLNTVQAIQDRLLRSECGPIYCDLHREDIDFLVDGYFHDHRVANGISRPRRGCHPPPSVAVVSRQRKATPSSTDASLPPASVNKASARRRPPQGSAPASVPRYIQTELFALT